MKKNKFKIISLFILILFTFSMYTNIYAASYSASLSATTITQGGTTKITIKANNVSGRVNVTSSNTSVAKVMLKDPPGVWIDNNTVTLTVTAVAPGSCKIIVTPDDLADSNSAANVTATAGTKTLSLTVKAKTTTPTPTAKSSNNYLSVLRVDAEGLMPNFNKNINNYSLTVGDSVTKLGLTLKTEDPKSTYTVTGNSNFTSGDNIVKVIVTAENKTTRTYKIIVTKAADPTKANAYLSSVLINGVAFQEFDSKQLDYKLADVGNEVTSLEIKAFPESKNATVDIIGADALQEGKNTIKITITAEDGKTKRTYSFEINRIKKEAGVVIYNEEDKLTAPDIINKSKSVYSILKEVFNEYGLVLTLYMLAAVELVQIFYLYNKVKKLDPNYDKMVLKKKEKSEDNDTRRKQ